MKIKFTILGLMLLTNIFGQEYSKVTKITSPIRNAYEQFGESVSIDNDYLIVGAKYESEDESGGNSLASAGAAYIYSKRNGSWEFTQKLVASDRAKEDWFGHSVCIFGDYVVVGAIWEDEDDDGQNTLSKAGAAYIFKKNDYGEWLEIQKLISSDRNHDDFFGYCVEIFERTIVISARDNDAGAIYIFEEESEDYWIEVQKLSASDAVNNDKFGSSLSVYGKSILVGSYAKGFEDKQYAGAAYFFNQDLSGIWSEKQKLLASDVDASNYFGGSVSISAKYAVIGADGESEDENGENSKRTAGAAYIFEINEDSYLTEIQKITPSDRHEVDWFGSSVIIDSNIAVIGSPYADIANSNNDTIFGAGAAYIFKRNESDGKWIETQKLTAPVANKNDRLTYYDVIDFSNNKIIIGASSEDHDKLEQDSIVEAGSAYIFELQESLRHQLISRETRLEIYPNPIIDNIHIDLFKTYESICIAIYDIVGHKVYFQEHININEIDIPFHYNSGQYLIKINTGNESLLSTKIIKR